MRNILCSFKVNKVNKFTSVSCKKHNLKKRLRVTMKVSALFCLTPIHINNVNDERAARGHKGGTDIRGRRGGGVRCGLAHEITPFRAPFLWTAPIMECERRRVGRDRTCISSFW